MSLNLLLLFVGCATTKQIEDLQREIDELKGHVEARATSDQLESHESEDAEAQSQIKLLEQQVADLSSEIDVLHEELADATADLRDELAEATADVAHVVAAGTTLNVPADFPSVPDALAWLDDKVIAGDALLTIQLAPGRYRLTETIVVSHRDGHRIQIIGDITDPSAVTLEFDGVTGVEVSKGSALGLLDGVTLAGDATDGAVGVYVHDNAVAECGPAVVVQGFGDEGFRAENGGVILARGTTSTGNENGYVAYDASLIRASESTATENRGAGFSAQRGSTIDVTGTSDAFASSTRNGGNGFTASVGSTISGQYAHSEENTSDGFEVTVGSVMDIRYGTADANFGNGVQASYGATLYAASVTASNSGSYGLWFYSSIGYLGGALVEYNDLDGVTSQLGSFVRISDATVSHNGEYGLYAASGSGAYRSGTDFSSNGEGDYYPTSLSTSPEGIDIY